MTDDQDAADGNRARGIHYVDLVLGAWRPREAALQLAAGLGVELLPTRPPEPRAQSLAISAEAIDAAAQGDILVNQAWDDASRISAALFGGTVIAVLAPRFDLPLRADNEWFFHFLRRLDRAVVIIGDEPTMRAIAKSPFERRRSIVSPEWEVEPDKIGPERMRLLRLFPGLLPRPIAEAANLVDEEVSLISIGDDRFLVPISYRDTDPRTAADDFDALEDIEARDDGFKAIAQSYCTSYFADSATLTAMSLHCFRSGSRDLAQDLAARARSVARDPASVAQAELARHEMALSVRRFADVVAAARLSPRAPAADKERLQGLKDWAKLAVGDLSGTAERVGATLRRLGTDEAVDAADIFRLDQVVRARQGAGDVDGALTLARSIAAALGRTGDQRLVYTNAMSLIRLFRLKDDWPALAREIDRAFAAAAGARCPSDVLMMNVLRAKAERDRTAPDAAACWLRAGIAWLCFEPRDGLSRDAAEAILGEGITARAGRADEISHALADGLAAAWPSIVGTDERRVPNVYPASAISAIALRRMYAGNGAAVLWSAETMTSPPPSSHQARLTRLVCAALAEICPPFADIDGGTISTDSNLGLDIPATRDQALSVALRLKVEEFYYGEERVTLSATERGRLSADLEVRLSPVVDDVTDVDGGSVAVSFKRYLPKQILSDGEAQLVTNLRDRASQRLRTMPLYTGDQSPESIEAVLRRLETAHVVRIELPRS